MEKHITGPGAGDDLDAGGTAYAETVAVEHDDYTEVSVSGMTSETDAADVEAQTRDILDQLRVAVERHGGSIRDVVRVRVYVASPHLTQANFEAIHAARRDYFAADALPASTLVEVSGLIRSGRLIEIDADAVVPADGWE
jgi:enamine deaminase RidA (YjgF/YER057c/UK114 family)